ncbi:MAG: hypothetical protein JXR91_01275 [Deltaproteobacteria bacterium]|nr:hypothetical protein [Deltaproteobacteria bacterium]
MNDIKLKIVREREKQSGFVLIIIMILVMMLSGLGLLAVRHAKQEAASTGAYADSTEAISLAQSALAVAMTALRKDPDYYQNNFSNAANIVNSAADMWRLEYDIPLSPNVFSLEGAVTGTICNAAAVPDVTGCVEILSSPFYDGGGLTSGEDHFPGSDFYTTITYDAPIVGPCPPGYSCFDDQNYAWYVFGINVNARFGYENQWLLGSKFVQSANAQGKGRVTIGPIGAYGR